MTTYASYIYSCISCLVVAYHSACMIHIQVTIGGMKFNPIQQRGVKCKELGPNVAMSIAPSSSYDEVVEKGKKEFFASTLPG